jgi:peroxidase
MLIDKSRLTFAVAFVAINCLARPTESLAEVRSFDGSGNNISHSLWGAANTQLSRIATADYIDGIGNVLLEPPMRANPRDVSNAIAAQSTDLPNRDGLTNYVWQWGQFIDHDMDLTENSDLNGVANVPLAPNDPLGPGPMPFARSNFDPLTGSGIGNPRQQINQISSYIDGSNVYGSDDGRASWLRTGVGGQMRTSEGNLLPFNDGTQPNAGMSELPNMSPEFFVAGDIRANEQPGLLAMHTLLMREHNRLANRLAMELPGASDEELFQTARRIVGAEIQAITYEEFLPALLGSAQLPAYGGYQGDVDASVVNEFANAFYRFGHTMLMPNFTLVEPGGGVSGSLPLRDSFFNPSFIADDPVNLDRLLGGLTSLAQEIDSRLIDDVRNFLFGPPGAGGLDLATLNLQRGRDHGLPDYNSLREAYGLLKKEKFLTDGLLTDGVTPNGITTDPDLAAAFSAVYDGDIDNVDPWIAGIAEDHLPGAPVGELVATALIDQFGRARDGDRFFFQNDPELQTAAIQAVIEIDAVTLKDIIEINTLARFDRDNLFVIPEPATYGICLVLAIWRWCPIRRRRPLRIDGPRCRLNRTSQ